MDSLSFLSHCCSTQTSVTCVLYHHLIFFDFETDQESGEHVVNFAVAQYFNGEKKMINGYNACKDFCDWLFTHQHKGFTAIAHNMKG